MLAPCLDLSSTVLGLEVDEDKQILREDQLEVLLPSAARL